MQSRRIRLATGGCDDEHSWAWISPAGEFIEVRNHSDWALANRQEQIYAEALSDRSEDQPLGILTNDQIRRSFIRAAVFDDENFRKGPPKDLIQKGQVYKIPDDVRLRAEKRGLPNLSMGTWPLRTRLTSSEEKFLAAEGVYPEIVEVDRDNSWNRKVMRAWENFGVDLSAALGIRASDALKREGWIKVSNAFALGGYREPNAKQWAAFFKNTIKCWKAVGIRPPVEKEKFFLSINSRYEEMTYAEAVDIYCPRDIQDEIFEYLLEGSPSPTLDKRQTARSEVFFDEYVRRTGIDPRTPSLPPKSPEAPSVLEAPSNPKRDRKMRERYPTRRASAERVAARYIEAKYDPYAPQSAAVVLDTHLYTMTVSDEDDLNLDVRREPSQMGALMKRARQWSLDEFTEYMEKYAWNNRIDELRKSLADEHLEYRVMVNGKVKDKGVTSEAKMPRLRESLADRYKYEKWADVMEIVTRPRPKSDYRKLDALLKAQAERERAWANLYADLRVPQPVLVDGMNSSDTVSVWVEDRGVRVGGIYLSKEDHTSNLMFPGCEDDIRNLVAQYGDGPVWTVPKSTMWPEYRGKGTGIALYLRGIEILRAKGPKPVYLEAHHCLRSKSGVFGLTSEDALRVWKKLAARFPSSGTVIAIV